MNNLECIVFIVHLQGRKKECGYNTVHEGQVHFPLWYAFFLLYSIILLHKSWWYKSQGSKRVVRKSVREHLILFTEIIYG